MPDAFSGTPGLSVGVSGPSSSDISLLAQLSNTTCGWFAGAAGSVWSSKEAARGCRETGGRQAWERKKNRQAWVLGGCRFVRTKILEEVLTISATEFDLGRSQNVTQQSQAWKSAVGER